MTAMRATSVGEQVGQMPKSTGVAIVLAKGAHTRRPPCPSIAKQAFLVGKRVGPLPRSVGVVFTGSVAAILTIATLSTRPGDRHGPCPNRLGVVSRRSAAVLRQPPQLLSTAALGTPIGILIGLQRESRGVVETTSVAVPVSIAICTSVNGK